MVPADQSRRLSSLLCSLSGAQPAASDKCPTGQRLSSAEARGREPPADLGLMPPCRFQVETKEIFCSSEAAEEMQTAEMLTIIGFMTN